MLSDKMRFIPASDDIVLGPGEVAAFDTVDLRTGSDSPARADG